MFFRRLRLLFVLMSALILVSAFSYVQTNSKKEKVLSTRAISLDNRQPDRFVNNVFKDNILLTLAYMDGQVLKEKPIDWENVKEEKDFEINLNSNETFAFHEDVLPEYKDRVTKTTTAHFNYTDGFVTDGYLYGDGVCHLASLMYWAAIDAGLATYAPTNHNFADIPDIPKKFGVSIYYMPGNTDGNALQNLYVTNNFEQPIALRFDYQENKLKLTIVKQLI